MASTFRSSCPSCGEIQDVPEGGSAVCPMCGGHVEPMPGLKEKPVNRDGDEVIVVLGAFILLISFLAGVSALFGAH